ncbi:hypothetical protein N1851_017702 [Merluccius polli]|uniref:Retinoic acid receptor responder protein 2 n=1 Tax=Merluccius polli TaxID=89951 RepID=A0AA47MP44_MERPO|nr:hypothetical protein N1851_017702 [Merluccius polli]
MAAALFWLLAAGSVLGGSSGVQGAYQRLQDTYRKGVDLAADRLNALAGISHHFRFFRTVSQSDIQPGFDVSYIYHHFYLKATVCPRGTVDASDCAFRNDRPLFDCATCYKTFAGEIEASPKPYVHCIHKPALTQVSPGDAPPHTSWGVLVLVHLVTLHNMDITWVEVMEDVVVFQDMKTARTNHCNNMGYRSGAPTLLASTGEEE